ncbi:MAG: potassium channel protein [Verrucomicrobia bacterium]|nr:potassium channel protein [Verrucomicrobiota bacterium]
MSLQKLLALSISIFLVVLLIGFVGFLVLNGGQDPLRSLYMAIITVFSVGYEEVIPVKDNPAAEVFTILFIVAGMTSFVFVTATATGFILEGYLHQILWRKKMHKRIEHLNEHYIVCGSGDTGHHVIEEFAKMGVPFVVIDRNRERVERLAGSEGFCYIEGDATDEDLLKEAGVERARGLVTSLPDDKSNLFVVLTARGLNKTMRIVARAVDEGTPAKLLKVGADAVISPNSIGGLRMASEMLRPNVTTFLDIMMRDRRNTLRFEEATIQDDSEFAGKTIAEADVGKKTGAIIVAVRDAETGHYTFNPRGDTPLKVNDVMVLIGDLDQITKLRRLAAKRGLTITETSGAAPVNPDAGERTDA